MRDHAERVVTGTRGFIEKTSRPVQRLRNLGANQMSNTHVIQDFRAEPVVGIRIEQLQGREALMTTTLDGKIKARLAGQAGDIREPDWGPFQKQ